MLKYTALYNDHKKHQASFVDFAGWQMPIQFEHGIIAEHQAVRNSVGLFDVSHMGQFEFTGPNAINAVNYLTTNNVKKLTNGKAQYSLLCDDNGMIIDDVIVYQLHNEHIIMVVNASNIEKDFNWCQSHLMDNTQIQNKSNDYALIAVQGPLSQQLLSNIISTDLSSIKPFHFSIVAFNNIPNIIIARTGYTGEDGFELFCAPKHASDLWNMCLTADSSINTQPIGLAARDTLRIEMKYSLYGNEISNSTNPIEAGLSWVVKLKNTDNFIGKKNLTTIKSQPQLRSLIGFEMIDRGIPRHGYDVIIDNNSKGMVTSGTKSPSTNNAIGIAYVPYAYSDIGSEFYIDIRGKYRKAKVVNTPFYQKKD